MISCSRRIQEVSSSAMYRLIQTLCMYQVTKTFERLHDLKSCGRKKVVFHPCYFCPVDSHIKLMFIRKKDGCFGMVVTRFLSSKIIDNMIDFDNCLLNITHVL